MDRTTFAGDLGTRIGGSARLAIMGIGADMRDDDAVGVLVARDLVTAVESMMTGGERGKEGNIEGELVESNNVLIMNASVVPEQFLIRINQFNPDHVVIIDAAIMGIEARPGDLCFIHESELDGATFSSHTLPLRHFIEMLRAIGSRASFTVIGVQPASLDYGDSLSPAVDDARVFLRSMLLQVLRDQFSME